MNDYIRNNLESGQRCRQWFLDYVAIVDGNNILKAKATAMKNKVDELETKAGEQSAAVSEGLSATDVKGSEREDLIAQMDPVRTAARGAEFDVPGTRDRYRFHRAMADQELLAAGRSFAAGGAADGTLLEDWGAPAGWPTKITNACDAFEAAIGAQDSAKGSSVAKNAELKALVTEMNALKGAIRHLVTNQTQDDPGARAAWQTAAHVKKSPSSGGDGGGGEEPPTP